MANLKVVTKKPNGGIQPEAFSYEKTELIRTLAEKFKVVIPVEVTKGANTAAIAALNGSPIQNSKFTITLEFLLATEGNKVRTTVNLI